MYRYCGSVFGKNIIVGRLSWQLETIFIRCNVDGVAPGDALKGQSTSRVSYCLKNVFFLLAPLSGGYSSFLSLTLDGIVDANISLSFNPLNIYGQETK